MREHEPRRRGCTLFALMAILAVPALPSATPAGLGGGAALAAAPALLPLMQPPSGEHHDGKIIFAQLVTPDLAKAKAFYGSLFGWTFKDLPIGRLPFCEAFLGDQAVAAMVEKPLPVATHGQPFWLTYISARDVDAATAAAKAHGAKLLSAPRTIPGLGRRAILFDPQGAVFALLDSASGDPPDELAAPGDWVWSSLITNDPAADSDFYADLFHYDLYRPAGPQESDRLIAASGGYARASINPLPVRRPDAGPSWVDFIRVSDVAAAAQKAAELGGRILVAPHADRQGDQVAVLADPAGAVFAVLALSADQAGDEAR